MFTNQLNQSTKKIPGREKVSTNVPTRSVGFYLDLKNNNPQN